MKHWRPNLLLSVFLLCGATILCRLLFLQIEKHNFYKALAVGQQVTGELAQGQRGEIFFRDGTPLASNKKGEYVFISPREIKDKEVTTQELVDILGLDFEEVLARAKQSNLFEPLKYDITKEEARALKEKNLIGVYVHEKVFRYYPQEVMAAHIVGFVGGEDIGQYGIEGYYDELLRGKEAVITETSGALAFFSELIERDTSGVDIVTTLDPVLQFIARKALLDNKDILNFKSGQIVIMEPISGEILAMAQVPSFDPNDYSKTEEIEIFQNSVIQKAYEPGSVFKPITMAAAIEEGSVTPETTFFDTGSVWVGQSEIKNYHQKAWGEQTMTNVLEQSINTGVVFAERELGDESFWEYIKRFGFLEETGIELQGELLPQNKEIQIGREASFVTASFGQGIELTPIQLIRAFTVFTNKGKMINPYIIKSMIPAIYESPRQESGKQIISEETALTITNMLVSVVDNGSAKRAGIKNYEIAGKTGTAQIAWPSLGISNKRGYSDETTQTFVGFAPAFDPAFLIMIKLDSPETETTEQSAVPMFRNIAQEIIDLWEIAPLQVLE